MFTDFEGFAEVPQSVLDQVHSLVKVACAYEDQRRVYFVADVVVNYIFGDLDNDGPVPSSDVIEGAFWVTLHAFSSGHFTESGLDWSQDTPPHIG